jgi:hypothetical protein
MGASSSGPTKKAARKDAWRTPLAVMRSSGATTCGTRALRAALNGPLAALTAAATITSEATVSPPDANSSVTAARVAARTRSSAIMIRRRSCRSATDAPSSVNANAGS